MPTAPTRQLLTRLPKAELHCHLDGSVRPATLLELGREYGARMPREEPDALREYMVVRDARNLEDYLDRFAITLSVMQHADAIELITYELLEDAARDGVRYMEVRYCPLLNTRGGLSPEAVVEASLRGIAQAERRLGVVGRVIVTALRNMPAERSMELARLAVAFKGQGVVAFDLAGGERGNPAAAHAEAFAYVRSHDLACTVHAGEGFGALSVRQAVHVCGADRIGHATRLFEDASLAAYVNDRRLPLEICLTSNVQTRAAPSYAEHPLRRYFDEGQVVTLNTDNRLMSGISLTDEYLLAAQHQAFTVAELADVAVNGFAAAFLPWPERRALVERARREIAELVAP